MPAIVINQGSTEGEIQKAKREIHKLEDYKADKIEKLNKLTDNRCVLTSFSFISLYMFFFSLMSLFVGGLNVTPFLKTYFATFTIISIVVLIIVTVYGERQVPNGLTSKLSLTNCCWTFLSVMVLSLMCLFYRMLVEIYSFVYWPITILLSAVLPYTAFVIFMMIIHKRLDGLNTELVKKATVFDDECQKVEAHIHQLKEAYELSVSMDSELAESVQPSVE